MKTLIYSFFLGLPFLIITTVSQGVQAVDSQSHWRDTTLNLEIEIKITDQKIDFRLTKDTRRKVRLEDQIKVSVKTINNSSSHAGKLYLYLNKEFSPEPAGDCNPLTKKGNGQFIRGALRPIVITPPPPGDDRHTGSILEITIDPKKMGPGRQILEMDLSNSCGSTGNLGRIEKIFNVIERLNILEGKVETGNLFGLQGSCLIRNDSFHSFEKVAILRVFASDDRFLNQGDVLVARKQVKNLTPYEERLVEFAIRQSPAIPQECHYFIFDLKENRENHDRLVTDYTFCPPTDQLEHRVVAFPNPYTEEAFVEFDVLEPQSSVSLIIFNKLGSKKMEVAANQIFGKGNHQIMIDWPQQNWGDVFYKLTINDKTYTGLLLKKN